MSLRPVFGNQSVNSSLVLINIDGVSDLVHIARPIHFVLHIHSRWLRRSSWLDEVDMILRRLALALIDA